MRGVFAGSQAAYSFFLSGFAAFPFLSSPRRHAFVTPPFPAADVQVHLVFF